MLYRVARDACRDPELGGPMARRTNLVKRAESGFKENRFRIKRFQHVASSHWTINNSSQLSSVVHCDIIRETQVTYIFEGPQFRYLDLRTLFGAVFVGLLQWRDGREDVAAASRSLSLSAIAAVASAVRVAVRQNIFSFCVTRIRDRKQKSLFHLRSPTSCLFHKSLSQKGKCSVSIVNYWQLDQCLQVSWRSLLAVFFLLLVLVFVFSLLGCPESSFVCSWFCFFSFPA